MTDVQSGGTLTRQSADRVYSVIVSQRTPSRCIKKEAFITQLAPFRFVCCFLESCPIDYTISAKIVVAEILVIEIINCSISEIEFTIRCKLITFFCKVIS